MKNKKLPRFTEETKKPRQSKAEVTERINNLININRKMRDRHTLFTDDDLESINTQIDKLIIEINAKIEILVKNQKWEAWDIDKEFNPNYYREKGYLDVEESPAFRKIVDACNCLGQNYKAVQQAWFKSKIYPNQEIAICKELTKLHEKSILINSNDLDDEDKDDSGKDSDDDSDIEETSNSLDKSSDEVVEEAPAATTGRRKGRRAVSTGVISTN